MKIEKSWKWTIFCKNGKPIALLFAKNWPKFAILRYFMSRDENGKKLKMDDFLQKWQAYSLTFCQKSAKIGLSEALFESKRKLKKVENRRFLDKMASL